MEMLHRLICFIATAGSSAIEQRHGGRTRRRGGPVATGRARRRFSRARRDQRRSRRARTRDRGAATTRLGDAI